MAQILRLLAFLSLPIGLLAVAWGNEAFSGGWEVLVGCVRVAAVAFAAWAISCGMVFDSKYLRDKPEILGDLLHLALYILWFLLIGFSLGLELQFGDRSQPIFYRY